MSARSHRKKYHLEDEDSDHERTGKRPRSGSIRRPLSRSSNGSRSPRSPRSKVYESDSDYESKSGVRRAKGKDRKSSLKSRGDYGSDDSDYESKSGVRHVKGKGRKSSLKSRDDYDSDDDVKSRSHLGRRKKRQFDEEEDEDVRRRGRGRREKERDGDEAQEDVEEYWFVCKRWFAKNEDDHKIVRELLPTTEDGKLLDGGLQGDSFDHLALCLCVYVCIWECICVCVYECMYGCMYVCMCV